MDTELLRTFLEVGRTRHFGRAAANLYLTQSAVSARIRQLEELVGVALFTRERNDIQPTPEGRRLQRHAETILTAWNRARQEIAVEDAGKSSLNMAVLVGLGPVLLDDWLLKFRQSHPHIVMHIEFLEAMTILKRLGEATLDIALTFEAPQFGGVRDEALLTARFVLVSTNSKASSVEALARDYILVNWGAWFTVAHARSFPELASPGVRLDSVRLARRLLLEQGGSAYLAHNMVVEDLGAGRLYIVEDAPVIERTVHALYPTTSENRHTIDGAIISFHDYANLFETAVS